jgi:hypothetical protein
MTQTKLRLKERRAKSEKATEFAEVVGLSCEDEVVTLRFMQERNAWGQPARQVRLDRKLAEQLSQLLNYELDRLELNEAL